jgi:hydrogenase nickel incorporation protein HypA/HybF
VHELSIVEALIEQVEKELRGSGHEGRVTRLELQIGRLSGVNPEAIRFALELLSPDTPVEGAEVEIDQPRANCVCSACGAETPIEEIEHRCPACGSTQISIEGGNELLLESIELQD